MNEKHESTVEQHCRRPICFLSPPSIWPPTVLPSRINSLSQHFFEKLIRYYQEEHNLMSEWMRNTKIESCATMQQTIYFLSPPSILPPTVLPLRKNSLSQHFIEKLIRYYQEEHNLMSEWMRNTKIDSWATCRRPSAFYRHHPFGPQQYYLREKFAESAFFRKINKILPRRTQPYERMNEKH